jgi:hypothetical protein
MLLVFIVAMSVLVSDSLSPDHKISNTPLWHIKRGTHAESSTKKK